MKIIKTEIVEIDGQTYKIETYNNGTVVKRLYECTIVDTKDNVLSQDEERELNDSSNIEYLVALQEMMVM